MSKTMRAILIEQFGGRDKLKLVEIPVPKIREAEVLVKIHAAGVNPVDWKIREGLLEKRGLPHRLPLILGWDMAGVIVERGHSARKFNIKEEVYACCRLPVIHQGTYAEFIAIPESYLSRRPKTLSFEESASVPLAALTAYQSLYVVGQIKKGETIFILGASGGVGSYAVQLSKLLGANVIGLASPNNHAYLKELGADGMIDYTRGDFRDTLRDLFPGGVDLVYACAGGDTLKKGYDCVRKNGRLITIVERGDEQLAKEKEIQLDYVFIEPNTKQLDHLCTLIESNQLRVPLTATYPLEAVQKAHEQIETAHTRGKIVLKL